MLQLIKGQVSYNPSLCQQCGACQAVCPTHTISTQLKQNGLHDILINHDTCIQCQKCVKTCPSNNKVSHPNYFSLFQNKNYFFAYNANHDIRRASSSGGSCKTLIIEGLKSKLFDGVYSLKKSDTYPYAEGEFYTQENIPFYEDMPNSIYHSVMLCSNISRVQKCNRLMIVGTSCQLRALEKALKGKYQELIKVCIFCKQQKTLDSTRFLAKIMGAGSINISQSFHTRYRGMGWPGIVHIKGAELPWNRAAQLPFGRRLWTVPGCNICGDPFGISVEADITLMDPWSIRTENKLGETLITVHSSKGLQLLQQVPSLTLEQKNYIEVLPALDLTDIWRKQQLIPYFKGERCSAKIKWAGRMELLQRGYLRLMATTPPRLPILYYRILAKIPDLRNLILKHKSWI